MKRTSFTMFAAVVFALAALAYAQQTFSNSDILNLWNQGFSEAFLVNVVQQNRGNYSLGPDDLRALVNAKVPNRVIEAMSAKAGPASINVGNVAPAASASAPAANAGGSPQWPAVASDTTVSYHPDGAAGWAAMVAEHVTWSRAGTGKMVKKVMSAGIAGRPFTGTLNGPSSLSVLTNPPEFVMDLPFGTNPTGWVLVRLEAHRKTRRVTDPMHEAIMIHMVERRANQYKMRSDNELSPGEYGLVNMSTVGDDHPSGFLYAFRVR